MTKVGEIGGRTDTWKELGMLGIAEALTKMAGVDTLSGVEGERETRVDRYRYILADGAERSDGQS